MDRNFNHCPLLRNIPKSKLSLLQESLIASCDICSKYNNIQCDKCNLVNKIYNRYYDANIPLEYWNKTITQFYGDKNLIKIYNNVSQDFNSFFQNGKSFFIKGQHGVGKTLLSSLLLKKVVEKGFEGLYTTLSEIVGIVHTNYKEKFDAMRELRMTDFLIIDEFDPRFYASDASAELFGRILESIIRIRFQNKLPTILISNNPDPIKAMGDSLSASLDSLISGYCEQIFAIGPDNRKK